MLFAQPPTVGRALQPRGHRRSARSRAPSWEEVPEPAQKLLVQCELGQEAPNFGKFLRAMRLYDGPGPVVDMHAGVKAREGSQGVGKGLALAWRSGDWKDCAMTS